MIIDQRLLVTEVEFGWCAKCKVIIVSNPTQLIYVEIMLRLSWGYDNTLSIIDITEDSIGVFELYGIVGGIRDIFTEVF